MKVASSISAVLLVLLTVCVIAAVIALGAIFLVKRAAGTHLVDPSDPAQTVVVPPEDTRIPAELGETFVP